MLENLFEFIFDSSLYSFCVAWSELDTFSFPRSVPLLVFATLPECVTKALNITGPRPPQAGVATLDKNENVVMSLDLQSASTVQY